MEPDIKQLIEICTQFAIKKGLSLPADEPLIRNRLLSLFAQESPYEGSLPELPQSLVPVLEQMVDYAAENNMLEMNTKAYRDLFDNKICGCLLMPQSQAQQIFEQFYAESPQKATDWFYTLCQNSNYIRTFDVAKNIQYTYPSSYGTLEITINLTKPEKDPKEIEKQKSMPQTNYPKCMLCIENVGYAGRLGYPSHETLRTIALELNEEPWHFQYSPYVYYNEHCIVFCNEHTPMTMNEKKFVRLFAFLKKFPHYFIGSNTQLPVVGGSILTHEHFQGGCHRMPMEKAGALFSFSCGDSAVSCCVVNWPMTCLRLTAENTENLLPVAEKILTTWQNYSDPSCGIFAYTDGQEHNTITPIVRINQAGLYECDIVLRNNLTTDELPLGVLHPHPDKHNIKKENIGLIEVMGLFILPGRLKKELEELAEVWVEKNDIAPDNIHFNWFHQFKDNFSPQTQQQALNIIYQQVGSVCENVLRDAGVYKEDEAGRAGVHRFLYACGFEV